MTANEGFFARKQAAAVLKHGVLKRYPTIFASMAGTGAPEVVLYDGYAGPGRYEDGSPGSPLLLVETALRTASFRKIRLMFSEEDMDTHTDLHRTLKEAAGDVVMWEADYGSVEQWAAPNVRSAGDAPMLTFLDPFGVGLSYRVLTEVLLGRPANLKTEVLLNINVESVRRIGGRLQELDSGSPMAGAEKTVARVDTFLGGDWWRPEFRRVQDSSTAAAAAEHVVSEFCTRVKSKTGFDAFQVPIRRRPGHQPHFILTLFCRHEVAPWKFNDSASSANADWRQACMQEDLERELSVPFAPSLFGGEHETAELIRSEREKAWGVQEKALEREWVTTIRGNLVGLLKDRPFVNLGPDLKAVYGPTLGLAREMHVKRAWDLLDDEQIVLPRDKGLRTLANGTVHRRPTT